MNTQDNTGTLTATGSIWWMVLIQGIALLLLGLWLLSSPGVTLSVLLLFLGIYWIISGVLHIIEMFMGTPGRSRLWLFISGILGIIAGLFAMSNPFASAVVATFSIVLLISFLAILAGIANIVRAFRGGGFGAFILGLVYGLIGLYLLFNPEGATIALPFVIAIFAIIGGIATIISSFSVRKLAH